MSVQKRIEILSGVGAALPIHSKTEETISIAYAVNSWFEPSFVRQALQAICSNFLQEEKLTHWLKPYCIEDDFLLKKKVGIICAGNLPLVGFHDFLCCYILGVPVQLKLSSKDSVLMRFVIQQILNEDKSYAASFSFEEKLKDFDAVIATGSTSTNRYFEYYFSRYPNILRSNRVSVAVLSGNESANDLNALAHDVFMYFGLGCRNVAKVFVPKHFDIANLIDSFSEYAWLHQNSQYMNNYDYNRTILLMNKTPHLSNEFVMLQESQQLYSPIATLFYERYENIEDVLKCLSENEENIQCIVGSGKEMISFGNAQKPKLNDYADGKDTIAFLLSL